jgi:8-oxo-dGTP diphosphatase
VLSTHEDEVFTYPYPHPAVAADIAIFTLRGGRLAILLIRRGGAPFKNSWALPGGFLRPDEDLDACARRELEEETAVETALLRQFGVFSDPRRDPRERVISVAYLALLPSDQAVATAGSDASATRWSLVGELPKLAFDHASIIEAAIRSLRSLVQSGEILLSLVPERFTLGQLQEAYEGVMGEPADKRNFRARFLASGLLRESGELERGPHRPARLFVRAGSGSHRKG